MSLSTCSCAISVYFLDGRGCQDSFGPCLFLRAFASTYEHESRVSRCVCVFEEVMRQKAGHGWSWGPSYGSLMVTYDPSNAVNSGGGGGHRRLYCYYYFRNKTAVLSRTHTASTLTRPLLGCRCAVWVTCRHQGATDGRKVRGWWFSHGSWSFCGLPRSWEENYQSRVCACVPVHTHVLCACLMMEECSSWCHGNRLSSVV